MSAVYREPPETCATCPYAPMSGFVFDLPGGVQVDLRCNTISNVRHTSERVQSSRTPCAILWVLAKGDLVPYGELLKAVRSTYVRDEPAARDVLKSHVHALRRSLKFIAPHLWIENERNVGYRLQVGELHKLPDTARDDAYLADYSLKVSGA